MSSRVFISYRSSDGADKATALARDLDALFGNEQVFLDKDDLPVGARWRDAIAGALHGAPILLVLITPNYLGALDDKGQRCIERDDDPARDELGLGLAAGAHIVPLLCDGVSAMPPASELPKPFDQLCELQWGRLRAYDWREDLARLADTLRALGLTPRLAATSLSAGDIASSSTQPTTAPMPLEDLVVAAPRAAAVSNGRRLVLGAGGLVALGLAGWGAMRWRRRLAVNLSGVWRVKIGARGATSARDGEPMSVTLVQEGDVLRFTSDAVDVTHSSDWENYRDFWKQRYGVELRRVFYRGEGQVLADQDDGSVAESAVTAAASDAPASGSRSADRAFDKPATWPQGAIKRRVEIAVHIYAAGGDREAIDGGTLRGIVDADDQRIRGRLWLNSEHADRSIDLRRG
jgi:hypothetical protein